MATLLAISPEAAARGLHMEFVDGSTTSLRVNAYEQKDVFEEWVEDTRHLGSTSITAKPGTGVTIRPGWVYMWEFHCHTIIFSVEFLTAKDAFASAGAATLLGRLVGRPEERLGLGGVFLKAVAYEP